MIQAGTIAAEIAVVLWIINGTTSKKVSRDLGSHMVSLLYVVLGVIPVIIATLVVGVYSIPVSSVAIAILGGIFMSVGFISAFKALHTEQLSTTVAFGEINPAGLVLFGLLVLGETVTPLELVSMTVIFIGAIMVIMTERFRINRKLIPAVIAACAWTLYWIVMTYSVTSAGTYALPILISRLVGIPFVLGYLLTRKNSLGTFRGFWERLRGSRTFAVLIALTVIGCFADATGDAIFGITIGSTVLVIGAALMALQPMITSFFGFLFYKERITRLQLAGIGVMVVGALVLSVL